MLGVAVVGAGHWGPNLIRNFHNYQSSMVKWVIEKDALRRAQVEVRFPEVSLGAELDPVLSDPAVDAVVIATPTSTHHSLARRALMAGKHVLVEKPIAATTAQAEELCKLANDFDLILMVGHVFVYNNGVREVKRHITEGTIGRLYYISMTRTNLGPIRTDVNAVWDLASHDVSIANHWLEAGPTRTSAVGGSWINAGLEDAVFATLHYPNDVLVHLQASWLNPRKARDITVVGDRCMVTLDDMNLGEPLRIYDKGVEDFSSENEFVDTFASFRASIREGDVTIPRVALGEPLKAECDHFLECIEQDKVPLTSGEQGLAVVKVLESIQSSLANGGREEEIV
jgi:predicted dehydrogenase